MTVRTEHDPEVNASYTYLFKGEISSTAEARPDILVDVAADRTVLGIEVIGDGDWTDGLVALAMAGRLRVARLHGKEDEMTAIGNLDAFLLSVVEGLQRKPRRYELRCHPDVYLALREAGDERALAETLGRYAPPPGFALGASPVYGFADVTVHPELGSGGWELYADGELLNSGRLGG